MCNSYTAILFFVTLRHVRPGLFKAMLLLSWTQSMNAPTKTVTGTQFGFKVVPTQKSESNEETQSLNYKQIYSNTDTIY